MGRDHIRYKYIFLFFVESAFSTMKPKLTFILEKKKLCFQPNPTTINIARQARILQFHVFILLELLSLQQVGGARVIFGPHPVEGPLLCVYVVPVGAPSIYLFMLL